MNASPDGNRAAFRASIYATKHFGLFVTVLAVCVVGCLLYLRQYGATACLAVIIMLLVLRLHQRTMSFGQSSFEYHGWFQRIQIPYAEMLKIEDASSLGYPTDRLHGPLEYRITTANQRYWVSLLWFPQPAKQEFRDRILR